MDLVSTILGGVGGLFIIIALNMLLNVSLPIKTWKNKSLLFLAFIFLGSALLGVKWFWADNYAETEDLNYALIYHAKTQQPSPELDVAIKKVLADGVLTKNEFSSLRKSFPEVFKNLDTSIPIKIENNYVVQPLKIAPLAKTSVILIDFGLTIVSIGAAYLFCFVAIRFWVSTRKKRREGSIKDQEDSIPSLRDKRFITYSIVIIFCLCAGFKLYFDSGDMGLEYEAQIAEFKEANADIPEIQNLLNEIYKDGAISNSELIKVFNIEAELNKSLIIANLKN